MADPLTRITSEALALSVEERAQLVDRLLESIPTDEDTPLSDAWMAEAKRRIQEIEDGMETYPAEEMETYPAEEVFAELRRECA